MSETAMPDSIAAGAIVVAGGTFSISITGESGESGESGGSVICTELHRQGYINDYIYKADEIFGKNLELKYPLVLKGYRIMAKPIVIQMKESRVFSKYVNLIARHWVKEMAYRIGYINQGDFFGLLLMLFGIPLAFFVGLIIDNLVFIGYLSIVLFFYILLVKRLNKRRIR